MKNSKIEINFPKLLGAYGGTAERERIILILRMIVPCVRDEQF